MLLPGLYPPGSRRPGPALINPCSGCALSFVKTRVRPVVPRDPLLVVVGAAPGAEDEERGLPFSGAVGSFVRGALATAGVDPTQVAFAYLTRCRTAVDDDPAWGRAEKRCRTYFSRDVEGPAPMLLLGLRPLRALVDPKARLGAARGLWHKVDDRDAYSARDPAQFLAVADEGARDALASEFREDVARMADRVLGREPPSKISIEVFDSPLSARAYLERLAACEEPWAFDIETYDGGAFPSRQGVSTDPCHPDFRLRGVAVATSPTSGAWVECRGWEARVAEAREVLSPAFGSPAGKWAFNGHFDEEGLVYPGWVPAVRNRSGDGLLALLALSDGEHESLRLEYAVVNVLGERQYWNGIDKSRMRDVPTETAARNAGGDACYTHQLCDLLHGRLARGEYFSWRKK